MAPDAVVRHLESLGERVPVTERRERLMRHRLRTMLTCYSRWHLVRVLPQAALVSLLEVVYSVVVGRRGQAGDVIRAWRWNLARRGEISEWRAKVAAFRVVPDAEIRRFQLRGSSRLALYLRGQTSGGGSRSDQAQASFRRFVDGMREGSLRWPVAAWVVTTVIVAFGSRHLILRPIAAVGGFTSFDLGPVALFHHYLSGWRDVGLGTESPAPTALALLSLLGFVFLGAMGTLRRVLLLGSLVLGLVGSYRLLRPTRSVRAQAVALVVYGAIPLGYDAIADARWGALAVYGVTPWVLGHLARAAGWEPFAAPTSPARHRPRSRMLALGLVLALVAAIDPAVLPVTLVVIAALVVGSLLVGVRVGTGRLAVVGVGAVAVAIVLHLPWTLDFLLPGATWEMVVGHAGVSGPASLAELFRFDVGPVGASVIAIGLPLAALLPLAIGREWRFEWAVRAWCVAIALVGLAWAGGEGWLPFALPPAELLLAPAAMALGLAAAMGMIAFETDLRAYGFGWRQGAAALAGLALLVGAVPTLLDAGNGRWYLPSGGLETTFGFLGREDPGYRVLWIGDPDVVPLQGYRLDDDLVYATSDDGLPSITDRWPGSAEGSTRLIEDALALADAGETSRLGRLLAPMSVRYIVLPRAAAPKPLGGLQRPIPQRVLDTLAGQLDLAEVPVNPAYVVYRNEAALGARTSLAPGAGAGSAFSVDASDLGGDTPVLEHQTGPTTFEGPVNADATILHATAAADGWELLVEGRPAPKTKLFGWADGYRPDTGGDAVLRYDTSLARYGVITLQAIFWVLAVLGVIRSRRREIAVSSPVEEVEA